MPVSVDVCLLKRMKKEESVSMHVDISVYLLPCFIFNFDLAVCVIALGVRLFFDDGDVEIFS